MHAAENEMKINFLHETILPLQPLYRSLDPLTFI